MDAIERLIDHVLAAAREKRAAEKAAKARHGGTEGRQRRE
jgi:hypothetical protein